ncbi:MAG: DHA2 family efflux MFS transporter permease subunit [Acetobacteraceae bacterium]
MSDTVTVPHRRLITASVMLAMFIQTLDSTISIVALPYIQGTMSASHDEISWVLTSYVIAAAIFTAPVGWMAQRFGRKRLFLICLGGFLCMSMLSGASQSLEQLITFRIIQGMFGAALAPMCQATMLDIYPFSQRAQAMAVFAMEITLGPTMGPTLGGWLTETYNWRWVFYVNIAPGLLAFAGVLIFLPRVPPRTNMTCSWYGFAMLGLAAGTFQLMLDRGQTQDWFNSREIIITATICGLCFYLFIVHMITAERPFLPLALFKDRNFFAGIIMVACVSSLMLSTASLMSPFLQQLGRYPVLDSGIAMAPRGFGTMIAMFVASWLARFFDQRKIMASGLLALGLAMTIMSRWTPDVTQIEMMAVLFLQGFSIGLVFNPMTVMAYTTLSPSLRPEATAVQSLARNLGSAIGISVTTFTLTRGTQVAHADVSAGITPFERMLQLGDAASRYLDPATRKGAALLDQMVTYQARIISYNNDFALMAFAVVPPLILLLFMRRAPRTG